MIDFTVDCLTDDDDEIYRFSDRNNHKDLPKLKIKIDDAEYTSKYWHEEAKKVLEEQLKKQPNTNKAKNVIFFLGDGLSHPTIGKLLEEFQESLVLEQFWVKL